MSVKLSVWGDEGMIPHFHFYKGVAPEKGIPNRGQGGGCICFTQPNYFIHGSHKDTLDNKEIKGLFDFLNSRHPKFKVTIWEYMIELWNNDNNKFRIPEDQEIPEYESDMESIKERK